MTEQQTVPGESADRPHRTSRRSYLIAAVLIVALAAVGTTAVAVVADDDESATTVADATASQAAATTPPTDAPTTAAPSPTVAGTRYRDEVFVDYTVESDVQYGSAPGLDGSPVALMLDVYQPVGDDATERPALVWVHGGGFKNGDKAAGVPPVMSPLFARLGYVVVSINYRLLAPESCNGVNGVSPECYNAAIEGVHDGQAAVRWLRANADVYDVDIDRIVIGGESAGAIIATGVGVYSDQPGESGNPGFASNVRGWVSISGGTPGGLFVDAADAPGLLISGTADEVVPYQWSVETANALQAVGVPNVLKTLDRAEHVPFVEYGDLIMLESIAFFYEHLDLANAA